MSTDNKHTAHGLLFKYDSDGMPTWVTIEQIKNFEGLGISLEARDVTTHDSGSWKEFIPAATRDPGEIVIGIIWDPDNAAGQYWLETNLGVRDKSFQVTFPSTDNQAFVVTGFVRELGAVQADEDGDLMRNITIKLTGAVTRS